MDIFEALNTISGALDHAFIEEVGVENFAEIAEAEGMIYNYIQEREGTYENNEVAYS